MIDQVADKVGPRKGNQLDGHTEIARQTVRVGDVKPHQLSTIVSIAERNDMGIEAYTQNASFANTGDGRWRGLRIRAGFGQRWLRGRYARLHSLGQLGV